MNYHHDDIIVGIFEELLDASPEARATVERYLKEAHQRGARLGEREERERLTKLFDGLTSKGTHT
jgi:hypothetical protein